MFLENNNNNTSNTIGNKTNMQKQIYNNITVHFSIIKQTQKVDKTKISRNLQHKKMGKYKHRRPPFKKDGKSKHI